jgi:hypothetical protein
MKDYSFLKKPVFFIFNLVFATWLVLVIEQIKPSDFGESSSFFESPARPRKVSPDDKPYLQKLASDYKAGRMDSLALNKALEDFLRPVKDQ